jgi:membrane associated rhomboid family serine protease
LDQTESMARSRSYSGSNIAYSFGPGPLTPAIKAIVIACVVLFFADALRPELRIYLGLVPRVVIEQLWIWQPFTYMFMHGGVGHILFNMLSLWMFGTELERMWGTPFFARFYAVCGLGAALAQIVLGVVLPGDLGASFYSVAVVGASGAIYGVMLAYAMYFPTREILMSFLFPVQAKYMVMILGLISLYMAITASGVAGAAHLGGLATGWLYLRGRRLRLTAELQYQFNRWRINRARRRFDVHPGGRDDRPRYH